jgi:hypothetical protein
MSQSPEGNAVTNREIANIQLSPTLRQFIWLSSWFNFYYGKHSEFRNRVIYHPNAAKWNAGEPVQFPCLGRYTALGKPGKTGQF